MAQVIASNPTAFAFSSEVGTPTIVDQFLWDNQNSGNRMGMDLGKGNSQAVLMVTGNSNGAGSTPYEHMGIYSTMTTNKNAPSGQFYDVVGGDFRGIINGATTGRAFGSYSWAETVSGSDGFLVGHEIGIRNAGSSQPNRNTITSKYGLKIVAESGLTTVAIDVSPGLSSGSFYKGLYFADGSLQAGGGGVRVPNNIDAIISGDSSGVDKRLFKLGGDNVCYIGEDAVGTKIGVRDVSFNYIGLKLILAGAPDSGGPGRRAVYCEN